MSSSETFPLLVDVLKGSIHIQRGWRQSLCKSSTFKSVRRAGSGPIEDVTCVNCRALHLARKDNVTYKPYT